MAKRSIGVTIGSAILAFQAVVFFALLLLMLTYRPLSGGGAFETAETVNASVLYGLCFLLTVVAEIGLSRLQPWARVLVFIMSGFGLFMGGIVVLLSLFLLTRSGVAAIFVGGVGASWVALSLWWFYLLNKPSVKQQFGSGGSGATIASRSSRPLSITIIAIMLFTTPLALFQLWNIPPSLSWMLGFQVPLWLFRTITLVLLPMSVAIGIGLWRLRPWARQVAIVYFVYGLLNGLLSFRVPLPSAAELYKSPLLHPDQVASMDTLMPLMRTAILIVAVISFLLQILFLVIRRKSFYRS
jgi:hypothetical protein